MNYKQAKRRALETIKNHWGEAILISLAYSVLLGILSTIFGIGAIIGGSLLLIGYHTALINASKNGKFVIEDLFKGINKETVTTRISMSVLKWVYITLWSLLFVIPGIIKSYSYMLTEYVALLNPEMTADECITESRRLMNGHKMKMFLLDLSFIGWDILCVFTFGIGYILLNPYKAQTKLEYINSNILEVIK